MDDLTGRRERSRWVGLWLCALLAAGCTDGDGDRPLKLKDPDASVALLMAGTIVDGHTNLLVESSRSTPDGRLVLGIDFSLTKFSDPRTRRLYPRGAREALLTSSSDSAAPTAPYRSRSRRMFTSATTS